MKQVNQTELKINDEVKLQLSAYTKYKFLGASTQIANHNRFLNLMNQKVSLFPNDMMFYKKDNV